LADRPSLEVPAWLGTEPLTGAAEGIVAGRVQFSWERSWRGLMECVPGRGHSSRGRLGMKEEEVAKLGELARIPEEMMGPTMLLFGC
jgi:hypothetical protein